MIVDDEHRTHKVLEKLYLPDSGIEAKCNLLKRNYRLRIPKNKQHREKLIIDKPVKGTKKEYIDLKIDGVAKRIPFRQIYYFQSLGNYIKIITNNKT